eukprot:scaffold24340_cov57-Phaeocystis_antarctica.AAC.1
MARKTMLMAVASFIQQGGYLAIIAKLFVSLALTLALTITITLTLTLTLTPTLPLTLTPSLSRTPSPPQRLLLRLPLPILALQLGQGRHARDHVAALHARHALLRAHDEDRLLRGGGRAQDGHGLHPLKPHVPADGARRLHRMQRPARGALHQVPAGLRDRGQEGRAGLSRLGQVLGQARPARLIYFLDTAGILSLLSTDCWDQTARTRYGARPGRRPIFWDSTFFCLLLDTCHRDMSFWTDLSFGPMLLENCLPRLAKPEAVPGRLCGLGTTDLRLQDAQSPFD